MSTQRFPCDDSDAPKENLDTWEPLTSEDEAATGAQTPEVIELPSPETVATANLGPGHVLADRYELLSLITDGAIGPVYAMFDRFIRNREALCILPAEALGARAQRRLTRGVETAKAVRHAGVAALFELSEDPARNIRFVTMEGVEGTPLVQVLREQNGSLPVWDALDIARQLCEALAVAHRHAEHLCLNPRNIVLQPDGAVKILELGLADALPRDAVLERAAAQGTEPYLAPELKNRFMEGDARADVYSVGVILYQMLTGQPPEDDAAAPSEFVRGVPPSVDRIVIQCLRRRPEERPRNMRALERILRRELHPQKGYLSLWIAAAASLAAVCAGLAFLSTDASVTEAPASITLVKNMPQPPTTHPPVPVADTEPTKPAPKEITAQKAERPKAPAKVVPPAKPVGRKPEKMIEVPPPTVPAPADAPSRTVPLARLEPSVPGTNIPTGPIGPRRVPLSDTTSSDGEPDVEVLEDLAPAPTVQNGEVPPPTTELQPRSARNAALRAQREAQSIRAERNAPEDIAAATAALAEAETWNNSGWNEEADQHYREAEQHFRRAIQRSFGPIGGTRSMASTSGSEAPAHSLVFVRLMPGPDGSTDRAEFAFNLLGGGQRKQVFSIGQEVADGWRLESIDPNNQTVRLRSGNQVISLAPTAAQRAPMPTTSNEARLP